jgi:hypothetical protein
MTGGSRLSAAARGEETAARYLGCAGPEGQCGLWRRGRLAGLPAQVGCLARLRPEDGEGEGG